MTAWSRNLSARERAIQLRGVRLTLESGAGPVEILKGIDLDVAQGEAVGLVGPSGSGKSTLLAVIAGLEQPSGGSVLVAGQEFSGLGEDALALARRHEIGIVFQAFHLIPTMTALENVAVPLELAGRRGRVRSRPGENCSRSASAIASPIIRGSFRGASSNALHSLALSRPAPGSFSPTSRPAISMAPPAPTSSSFFSSFGKSAARLSFSSPMTNRWLSGAGGSSGSRMAGSITTTAAGHRER